MTEHLLPRINRPQDLHALTDEELQQVAQEVREHIIDTVGEIGGHFGANLGTCEIAVALHSLLDSPTRQDPVGRRPSGLPAQGSHRPPRPAGHDPPLRRAGAVLLDRAESEHDIMGAGHASTAIGYAVGIKEAMRRGHAPDGHVVAVAGDGALTGGVAFEAVHQAGGEGTPIVVVLNDNGMSIAPNVGALSRYFNRVRLNPKLWHAREGVEGGLTKLPVGIGPAFERLGPHVKESIKAFWAPGLWWEELDFAYMGVIDGHDVRALRRALREALAAERPVVVHCATVKGKGFAPAEEGGLEGMEKWHAAKPKSIANGAPAPALAVARVGRGQAGAARLHAGVRRGAGRRGRPRRARDRHHRGDELGHRAEHAPARAARPLLRRRHRRAAGDPVRGRAGPAGLQAGGGDLLDVPAARLRPDRPRRLPAEAQRGVRHGPRRAGRRRRAHPSRRVRHRLPALPAQHRADGAARRGDAGPHAAHGAELRRRAGGAALSARRRASACRCRDAPEVLEIGTGEILREAEARRAAAPGSRCSATAPASARRWRRPTSSPSTGSR